MDRLGIKDGRAASSREEVLVFPLHNLRTGNRRPVAGVTYGDPPFSFAV